MRVLTVPDELITVVNLEINMYMYIKLYCNLRLHVNVIISLFVRQLLTHSNVI